MLWALLLLFAQDPADQLRRQELSLRLTDLAESGKIDSFARAVLRELRAKRTDGPLLEQCWRTVSRRPWDGKLDGLIEAWDKAAASEAPAPGAALFRVRLEVLAGRARPAKEKLEDAVRRFPADPLLLWAAGKARIDAGEFETAARALEASGAVDVDEFHRLLVRCYAETGRPEAAIEHLRAIPERSAETRELAQLAARNRLHAEAARLFRLALLEEPERTALGVSIVAQLSAAGELREAAAERRRMWEVDGAVKTAQVEEYFHLLAPEGRSAEIVLSLRQLLDAQADAAARMTQFAALARTVPGECRGSVMSEWEKTETGGFDWALLGRMKRLWGPRADALETLTQAEKLYPKDAWVAREQIECYGALDRFREMGDAYTKLTELDPDCRKTGPRPYEQIARLVENLMILDAAAAFGIAFRTLREPGLEAAGRRKMKDSLGQVWDRAGAGAWDFVRKVRLEPPPKDVADAARASIEKLSADEFAARSAAAEELKKLGGPALPVLLGHLDDGDAEVRTRVRDVVRSIFTD